MSKFINDIRVCIVLVPWVFQSLGQQVWTSLAACLQCAKGSYVDILWDDGGKVFSFIILYQAQSSCWGWFICSTWYQRVHTYVSGQSHFSHFLDWLGWKGNEPPSPACMQLRENGTSLIGRKKSTFIFLTGVISAENRFLFIFERTLISLLPVFFRKKKCAFSELKM